MTPFQGWTQDPVTLRWTHGIVVDGVRYVDGVAVPRQTPTDQDFRQLVSFARFMEDGVCLLPALMFLEESYPLVGQVARQMYEGRVEPEFQELVERVRAQV